jgi:hypothetical protein
MKKVVGVAVFMFVIGQLFAQQAARTYYHIEVYSRASNYLGDIPAFSVDESKLDRDQAYYQFYHKNTGYVFFLYATKDEASAVTAPSRAPSNAVAVKIFDWSGASYDMYQVQIDKIVTKNLLTKKSEVEKLQAALKHKLWVVPR